MEGSAVRRGAVRWIVKSVVFIVVFGAILLLTSGDWGWRMAWVYVGVFAAQQAAIAILLPAELLAERSAQQAGTKEWDRVLSMLGALVFPLAIYTLAGLDRRYGWTRALSPAVAAVALGVMVLGVVLTTWAMRANAFFSGTVRIQEERGHAVTTGGPYRWVRHPGYVGGILHHLAAPVMLGSLWALIAGALGALTLLVRTALEDHALHEELEGYAGYAQEVRYRLVPGVW